MNIEDMSVEEICKRINIQANLIDLQSRNKKKVSSAIASLAAIIKLAGRKDALYALCGYYILEIEHIDDIELFFNALRNVESLELLKLILKDITKYKNVFRRRLFIEDFLRSLSSAMNKPDAKIENEIKLLIENSVWGEKLKRKFLYHMDMETF